MNPFEAQALENVLTSVIVAATIIVVAVAGFKAWAGRATVIGRQDTGRLLEGVETLTATVEDMRHDLSEISDRLDFTERLLTRVVEQEGAQSRRLPEP